MIIQNLVCLRTAHSEFCNRFLALEPFDHVQNEIIPILKAGVQNRFAILRLIVFVERSKAFEVAAEKLNRLGGQLLRIIAEAVIQQPPPDHVVGDSQIGPSHDDGLPVARRLCIFSMRERVRMPNGALNVFASRYCPTTILSACSDGCKPSPERKKS